MSDEVKIVDGMTLRPVSDYADSETPPMSDEARTVSARRELDTLLLDFKPKFTTRQHDEQRISWVYGNVKLSNPSVTREMIAQMDKERKLSKLKLPYDAADTSPTHNPLAELRRRFGVKSGVAAKLLGISRQRLHVVEHATKPLPCMQRLLDKATMVWPVSNETPSKESK
ncbi:MAG: hypothetical protein E6Q97_28955 [Desulfurellales bacterium]|nr:MAG: hypothetical protein E6Q97_28955 [Desulfurellales bacterium]